MNSQRRSRVVGIVPVDGPQDIGRVEKAAAGSFLRAYNDSVVIFAAFKSYEPALIDSRTAIVPVEMMLY